MGSATEGNLEKIFSILHALGKFVVFVDEAIRQPKTFRGDETGISGRIMPCCQEMSDTANRERLSGFLRQAGPNLLEIDLKRQGRLDVHIPLFPPETDEEKAAFYRYGQKNRVGLKEEEIPESSVHPLPWR
jgi:hypothetical protein